MYIRHTLFKGDRVSIGGHCWIYPVYIIKDKSKILLVRGGHDFLEPLLGILNCKETDKNYVYTIINTA